MNKQIFHCVVDLRNLDCVHEAMLLITIYVYVYNNRKSLFGKNIDNCQAPHIAIPHREPLLSKRFPNLLGFIEIDIGVIEDGRQYHKIPKHSPNTRKIAVVILKCN